VNTRSANALSCLSSSVDICLEEYQQWGIGHHRSYGEATASIQGRGVPKAARSGPVTERNRINCRMTLRLDTSVIYPRKSHLSAIRKPASGPSNPAPRQSDPRAALCYQRKACPGITRKSVGSGYVGLGLDKTCDRRPKKRVYRSAQISNLAFRSQRRIRRRRTYLERRMVTETTIQGTEAIKNSIVNGSYFKLILIRVPLVF
jgi:hypothetical protein